MSHLAHRANRHLPVAIRLLVLHTPHLADGTGSTTLLVSPKRSPSTADLKPASQYPRAMDRSVPDGQITPYEDLCREIARSS